MRSHQTEISIEKMAGMLDVSRSSFYRPSNDRKNAFNEDIETIFQEHKGRYGSPRVHAELKRRGLCCSRYYVEKQMKVLGLYAGKRKKKPKTTIPIGEARGIC